MSDKKITFTGYHGTSAQSYNKIIKDGFKKSSKKGWTGTGVYFYEDDKEMAHDWAKYKFPHGKIAVIKSSVEVFNSKLLDVSDPKSQQNKKAQDFRKKFLEKAINSHITIDMRDEDIDCKILNVICELDNYDVVRNFTYTYKDFDRKLGEKRSNIPNGIELCVVNYGCIIIEK